MKESESPLRKKASRAAASPRVAHVVVRPATAAEAASIDHALARVIEAIVVSEPRAAFDFTQGELHEQRRPIDPHPRQ